jgi:dihydroorotase-like cyclic amidohydrolase
VKVETPVPSYDLLITNVRAVRPDIDVVEDADIAVADGVIVRVAPRIDAAAAEVVDGRGMLAFPRGGRRPPALGDLQPPRLRRIGGEPRRGAGRRDDRDHLHPHPNRSWVVRAEDSESAQEYTPFEGLEMSARVEQVFQRGRRILHDGNVVGQPHGTFIRRPTDRRTPDQR